MGYQMNIEPAEDTCDVAAEAFKKYSKDLRKLLLSLEHG